MINAQMYKPIISSSNLPDHNVLVSFWPHPRQLNKTLEKAEVVIFRVSLLAAIWTETTAAVMTAIVATLIYGYKHVCE